MPPLVCGGIPHHQSEPLEEPQQEDARQRDVEVLVASSFTITGGKQQWRMPDLRRINPKWPNEPTAHPEW